MEDKDGKALELGKQMSLAHIRYLASELAKPGMKVVVDNAWLENMTGKQSMIVCYEISAALYALLSLVDTAQEIIDEYPEADCPFHNNFDLDGGKNCLLVLMGGHHGGE